jgi:hypothetical protein
MSNEVKNDKEKLNLNNSNSILNEVIYDLVAQAGQFTSRYGLKHGLEAAQGAMYFLYYHMLYEVGKTKLLVSNILSPEMIKDVESAVAEELIPLAEQFETLLKQTGFDSIQPVVPKNNLN